MNWTNQTRTAIALALNIAIGSAVFVPAAMAEKNNLTEEILVIGSRHKINPEQSIVPINFIESEALTRAADTDINNIISHLVPSYNVNQQSLDDEATFVRPANLRGLPADATLILVNGKRRHKSSVITFLGGAVSNGSHAPDISSIPTIALQRIEVLLDGASAQYGSDAVAGVINFVLKDDAEGGQLIARYGEYKAGDGSKTTLGYNVGLPIGNNGALNLSLETYRQQRSVRVIQRDDAQALIDAGNTNVPQPYAQTAWGQPKISDDYKFLANAKLDLNDNNELYGFVNIAERTVNGGFYYRNPHTRSGVFKGPLNDNGSPNDPTDDFATIRVVSLDGSAGCNHIPIVNNAPDPTALAAVQASDNCYSFYETFPGGFTPNFTGEVEDLALVTGLRGQLSNDWAYDFGLSYGKHKTTYFLNNTVNPQLAHDYAQGNIVTDFNPGAHEEEDLTVTLDFTGEMETFNQPIDVAYGLEYRTEKYTIIAGGQNSWFIYTDSAGDNTLATQGLGVGSNGYVGFPTSIAGSHERSNYAAYADFKLTPFDRLTTEVALRYEDYEDFGDTLDMKLSGRWQSTPTLSFRGSVGTGFRAPTAGQANTRKITTEFSGGALIDTAILPATDPVARFKGAKPLKAEEAVHIALGMVHDTDNGHFSLDLFHIQLKDRIVRSSDIQITAADRIALGAAAARYDTVRFFLNDFETSTEGVDVTYSRSTDMLGGSTIWTANLNYTKTSIDAFDPDFLNSVDRELIESSLPAVRFNVEANHVVRNWNFITRLRYYDSFYNNNTEAVGAGYIANDEWLVDVELGYEFSEGVTFALGAENIFDNYPDNNPHAGGVGDKYAVDSPFGFNGAFYYARLGWLF